MSKIAIDIEKLSVQERLDLISALWDSISDEEFEDELTPEQKAEMDSIMARAQERPEECLSLEEAFRELRSTKR